MVMRTGNNANNGEEDCDVENTLDDKSADGDNNESNNANANNYNPMSISFHFINPAALQTTISNYESIASYYLYSINHIIPCLQ